MDLGVGKGEIKLRKGETGRKGESDLHNKDLCGRELDREPEGRAGGGRIDLEADRLEAGLGEGQGQGHVMTFVPSPPHPPAPWPSGDNSYIKNIK